MRKRPPLIGIVLFEIIPQVLLSMFLVTIFCVFLNAGPEEETATAPAPPPIEQALPLGISLPGKCISVHDGDTMTVEFKFRASVRLLDCWAPELKRHAKDKNGNDLIDKKTGKPVLEDNPDGQAAMRSLKRLADDKPCAVFIPFNQDIGKMTSMGRVLGKVYVNGDELGYEQVRLKHASKTKKQEAEDFQE